MRRRTIFRIRSFIFGTDARQALRIERLLLASSTYCFGMFIVSYCRWYGLFPSGVYWPVLGGAIVLNLLFYVCIRFNWNLRARDPSLTIPQMLVASMVNTYLVLNTTEARGAFLLGYVLVLVFGIFKLRRTQYLQIGAVVIGTYGAIISVEYFLKKPGFHLQVELLQWLMLVFVYPWFAWMGAYIGDLRRRQRETNERLERALSENSKALQVIRKQATSDELTGLYNRRYMLDQLALEKTRATAAGTTFCVLIIDVDFFKHINDSVGHFVGDRVLVQCVEAIKTALRHTDTIARWGGEEFMVLMPAVRLASVRDVIDRIHRCVEALDHAGFGLAAAVTVSIGAAEWCTEETIEELLTSADNALYRAKSNGRNRTEFRLAAA
jgi:diguanylate cyclase